MTTPSRALAVIPARGGSKRIPKKNLRPLGGKPLLAYTIEAAVNSRLFSRVIVSTDSEEIAALARECQAEVPFLREARLADDHTVSSEVTLDVLLRLDPDGTRFDVVAQLLPNCPLRTAQDVADQYQHFLNSGADAQLSVTRYGWVNPWWAMKLGPTGRPEPIFKEALVTRSQDLPELYCPTGAIWFARCEALRRARTFYTPGHVAAELPWSRALDIDDEGEWQLAELLIQSRRKASPP